MNGSQSTNHKELYKLGDTCWRHIRFSSAHPPQPTGWRAGRRRPIVHQLSPSDESDPELVAGDMVRQQEHRSGCGNQTAGPSKSSSGRYRVLAAGIPRPRVRAAISDRWPEKPWRRAMPRLWSVVVSTPLAGTGSIPFASRIGAGWIVWPVLHIPRALLQWR